MIVDNYMTKDLITVTKDVKINDAVDLMNEHNIHRLPVLEGDKLIGLITEGTIQSAMPSEATSLSVYEMNYLLNKTTVEDVMIKKVETVKNSALIEDAINIMRKKNVGVLPVCSGEGKLVGIITNNDIFDAFLKITGYNQDGVRVTIEIENDHEGVLAELTKVFAENDMNIVQIVVYRKQDIPTIVVQLTNTDENEVKKLVNEKGYRVLSSVKTIKDGASL